MSKDNVITFKKPSEKADDPLMAILREGARQLLAQALETEIQLFKEQYQPLRLDDNSPQGFCRKFWRILLKWNRLNF